MATIAGIVLALFGSLVFGVVMGKCIAFGAGKPVKPLLRWPR